MSGGKIPQHRFYLGRANMRWHDEAMEKITKRMKEANEANTLPGRSFYIKTIHYRDNHVGLYLCEKWTYGT